LKLTSAPQKWGRKRTRREYFLRETKTQVGTRATVLVEQAEDFSFLSFQPCLPSRSGKSKSRLKGR